MSNEVSVPGETRPMRFENVRNGVGNVTSEMMNAIIDNQVTDVHLSVMVDGVEYEILTFDPLTNSYIVKVK